MYGGAQACAFSTTNGMIWLASQMCRQIDMTNLALVWTMDTLPMACTIGDMVIMPTGDVVIINGAIKRCQGWSKASNPMVTPMLYASNNPHVRFKTLATTSIPWVYHSIANLLSDGQILVAESNTNQYYMLNDMGQSFWCCSRRRACNRH